MEKTVLCLGCPTPKKTPLCFESKEGCSRALLIHTRKASGRAVR